MFHVKHWAFLSRVFSSLTLYLPDDGLSKVGLYAHTDIVLPPSRALSFTGYLVDLSTGTAGKVSQSKIDLPVVTVRH
jgi:hypothetical protein